MRVVSIILTMVVVGVVTTAKGQTPGRFHPQMVVVASPVYVRGHAATAAESFARGKAALVQAEAAYLYWASVSRINAAEARRREAENDVRATIAYFTKRDINRSHTHPSQPSHYAGGRSAKVAPVSKSNATQARYWAREGQLPEVLMAAKYEAYRTLAEKALTGETLSSAERELLAESSREVLDSLKADIKLIPCSRYIEAKRFVERLARVSRAAEGCLADEQSLVSAAQAVDVGTDVDEVAVPGLLGRHVVDGPHDAALVRKPLTSHPVRLEHR
jgi:hypothetical protein